jgi:hypothetical protein
MRDYDLDAIVAGEIVKECIKRLRLESFDISEVHCDEELLSISEFRKLLTVKNDMPENVTIFFKRKGKILGGFWCSFKLSAGVECIVNYSINDDNPLFSNMLDQFCKLLAEFKFEIKVKF